MKRIVFDNFEAVLVGAASTGDFDLYLHIIGPREATRAIWARLSSADTRRSGRPKGIAVDGWDIVLDRGTRYRTLSVVLPCGYLDLAMLHPSLLPLHGGDPFYLLVSHPSPVPPPGFLTRLRRSLLLPILPEWGEFLWRDGLAGVSIQEDRLGWLRRRHERTIHRLRGFGDMSAYAVFGDSMRETWLAIIRARGCTAPRPEYLEHVTLTRDEEER